MKPGVASGFFGEPASYHSETHTLRRSLVGKQKTEQPETNPQHETKLRLDGSAALLVSIS